MRLPLSLGFKCIEHISQALSSSLSMEPRYRRRMEDAPGGGGGLSRTQGLQQIQGITDQIQVDRGDNQSLVIHISV